MKLHWQHFPQRFDVSALVMVEEMWGLYVGDIHLGTVWRDIGGPGWQWTAGSDQLGIPIWSGPNYLNPMDAREAALAHVGLFADRVTEFESPELAGGNGR